MTAKRFIEIISVEKVIDTETGKEYKCIIDNELLELLNKLHEEKESYMIEIRRLEEENKFLQNKVATYKVGNRLLKESLNETKKYKDVLMNFDESKIIKIDKNNGTIELIDKEWK